jgi:sulfonate transport system substrate-binding protein
VRLLADGRGIADYQRYYLAASDYANAHGDVLGVVFAELVRTGNWVKSAPQEAAALLAPVWGLDAATIALANGRRSYAVRAVRPENLAEQQRIADAFLKEGLLPKRVDTLAPPLWKVRAG